MDYKKYVYVIYSLSESKIMAIFSSEKRLYDYAREHMIKVEKPFSISRKLHHECWFHPGPIINGNRYDLMVVKIPVDEPCENQLQELLQKTASATFCKKSPGENLQHGEIISVLPLKEQKL